MLPLPVISLLSFKFPFIKIKPHFLLIFPVFFSKTECDSKSCFFSLLCFPATSSLKSSFNAPLPKKQLRDLVHPNLPFVWETRGRMRSWGGGSALSVCLPACLLEMFYWVSSRCWKDQLGIRLFDGFAQTLGLMVMFQHIMLIAGMTWPSMSIWSGSCSENLSSTK